MPLLFFGSPVWCAEAPVDGWEVAQSAPRPFDSRPLNAPPTPAPRSSNSGTMVLPRVPRIDRDPGSLRPVPGQGTRRGPESQRVVPKPPGSGGDPAAFFDRQAENVLSCEQLRRLAERTGRLYWVNRYERCLGAR
jgi:hypothetical protein